MSHLEKQRKMACLHERTPLTFKVCELCILTLGGESSQETRAADSEPMELAL